MNQIYRKLRDKIKYYLFGMVFMMDGDEHYFDNEKCCGHHGKTCECGGHMHYQPVYDGYIYKCEKCKHEGG